MNQEDFSLDFLNSIQQPKNKNEILENDSYSWKIG